MNIKKDKVYILSGAIGTEIFRRGFPTELPLWSAKVLFEKPELLEQIYIDYINAGADIITTNTFRTQKRTLDKAGLKEEWERINSLSVKVCQNAVSFAKADRPVYIAASVTTLEDCYRPDLVPPNEILIKEHYEQILFFANTEVDFLLLETFNTIRESAIAAEIAAKSGKPFAISFVLNENADLVSGEKLVDAIAKITPLKPLAFLVNCVKPEIIYKALPIMSKATVLPIGAYGNGDGKPSDNQGWEFEGKEKIKKYAQDCKNWLALGANIVGGCCGTSPEYTKEYAKLK